MCSLYSLSRKWLRLDISITACYQHVCDANYSVKRLRKFPMSMTFTLSKSIHRFGVKTNGGGGANWFFLQ